MANKNFSDFSAINYSSLAGTDLVCTQTDVGVTNAYKKLTKTQLESGINGLITTAFGASPAFTSPSLGVAGATSINKVAFTAPATVATLTIANNKTLACNNNITLSGTDGKTATFSNSLTFAGTDGKTLTVSHNLTLAGVDGTTLTFQGTDTYVGRATIDTLTNKRVTPRAVQLTDAATVTPNSDTTDFGYLLTVSQATQFLNPTGTPTDGQRIRFRLKSTAQRALTFDTQYRFSVDLATISTSSGSSLTDYMTFDWNATDSKWDCVAKNFGF